MSPLLSDSPGLHGDSCQHHHPSAGTWAFPEDSPASPLSPPSPLPDFHCSLRLRSLHLVIWGQGSLVFAHILLSLFLLGFEIQNPGI